MSAQSDARKNETARQTRTERELAKLESEEQGSAPAAAEPVKPKAKPKEKVGTGRNDANANFVRLSAGLRKQIQTAKSAGNNTLAAKLEARLAELKKMTEQSQ